MIEKLSNLFMEDLNLDSNRYEINKTDLNVKANLFWSK